MHHITPHCTPLHSLKLFSATFHHVLLRSIRSSNAAFASKSLWNPLLRHITTDSSPLQNMAAIPQNSTVFCLVPFCKRRLHSSPEQSGTVYCITSHPITVHSTTLNFISQNSTVFFYIPFLQKRLNSLPTYYGLSIASHQTPFLFILQDSTPFHYIPPRPFAFHSDK